MPLKIKWLLSKLKSLVPTQCTLPSHPNLSSFSLHCAIHRCMQLISKLFTPLFKSYYLRNIISLQNERALTKLSKSNEAYSSLETASRINSDIGNATFGGLKCYQWGKEGIFFFLFFLNESVYHLMSVPVLFLAAING